MLPPLHVHEKVYTGWLKTMGQLGQASAKVTCFETIASVQMGVDMTLKRVEAELPQRGLFADLCIFDLRSVPEHPCQDWCLALRRLFPCSEHWSRQILPSPSSSSASGRTAASRRAPKP